MPAVLSTERSRIIFGIDFGTTYSGVSYVQSGFGPEAIRTITRWPYPADTTPDNDVSSAKKAPTVLWYAGRDADVAYGEDGPPIPSETVWGYAVPPELRSLRWFKLLLLDDKDLRAYLSPAAMSHLTKMRDIIKESGKDVLDIVADFLRYLWKHSLDQVTSHIGRVVLEESPFTVVVTVPAMWKSAVRSRMRTAVMKAGILEKQDTAFHFISEPEAAALARLHDLRTSSSIREGDCLTVVDFGGGTVDIISYEVTSESPFAVREVVEGKGGLCGAIFLDQAFRKMIIRMIGPENWDRVPRDEAEYFIEQQWERGLKRLYTRGRNAAFRLTGAFMQATGQTRLRIDSDTLQDFFTTNPIIRESLDLIKAQVAAVKEKKMGKPPKYVVLAGGFGASLFLKEEIERELGNDSDTQVIQGGASDIWEAVSKGAAMSVAQGTVGENIAKVEARIARACYGFMHNASWVDGLYDERDKFWCDIEACYKARNQIDWFLKKGDVSSRPQPFDLAYARVWKPSTPRSYPNLAGTVWTYEGFNPPKRWEPGVVSGHRINHKPNIRFEDLPEQRNPDGGIYKYLNFKYAGMCHGNSIDVSIIINGDRIAYENFDIESEVTQSAPLEAPASVPPSASIPNSSNIAPVPAPQPAAVTRTPDRNTQYSAVEEALPPPPSYTPYNSRWSAQQNPTRSSPELDGTGGSLFRHMPRSRSPTRRGRPSTPRPRPYDSPPSTNPTSPEPVGFKPTNPFSDPPRQSHPLDELRAYPSGSPAISCPPPPFPSHGDPALVSHTVLPTVGGPSGGAGVPTPAASPRLDPEEDRKGKVGKWLKKIIRKKE